MELNEIDNALTKVLSLSEAAALYGVSTECIRYHIDRGNLTYRQIERGVYLIDLDSLNELSERLHGITLNGLPSSLVQFRIF